ncbi:hypothetical protein BT96DRAFT_979539 [Gymnopus androsaceus JB14]|uniref:Uncharacterized protein n=1 Tax=Gymnopus androsaceus JB14 TaxID=1447944 RepID=A0A6A4H388_9AGAR|nr:hypothetical protein BT96DRAFT_979539 [Gymnopus androsaceus JB14]
MGGFLLGLQMNWNKNIRRCHDAPSRNRNSAIIVHRVMRHFNLARSRAYEGPNASLKRILRKAQSTPTQPLKIGIIGGSVSRGHGVTPEANWAAIYADYLRDTYHIAVELINGSCWRDGGWKSLAKSYENLIRALRVLPKKPAIINLQIMALMFSTITMGGDLHMAIAQYYDTPVISMRNVLLPQILQTTELNSTDTSFEDYWFNHDSDGIDLRHLGTNGHRMLADLLKSFTSRVACDAWREMHFDWNGVESWVPTINEGLLPTDKDEVKEYLPRQSLFQQYDHTTPDSEAQETLNNIFFNHCLTHYRPKAKMRSKLWSHPANPGKIWLTGWKPGVKVAFKVWASTLGRVRVSYLKSKTYGLGSLFCWVDGDEVGGKRMDGWWDVENMHAPATTTIGENLAPAQRMETSDSFVPRQNGAYWYPARESSDSSAS